MLISRRPFLAGLALLPLGGCGGGLPKGLWQAIYDPNDRIQVLSGKTAQVTALFGQPLDAWLDLHNKAQSDFGQTLRDAERDLAQYETVDVTYRLEGEKVILTSETRGERLLLRAGDDMLDDPAWTLRTYLWQKG